MQICVQHYNGITHYINHIWVSKWKFLGARYSASASLPLSQNDLTSDLKGNIGGGSGFADSYYLQVILGWSWSRAAGDGGEGGAGGKLLIPA